MCAPPVHHRLPRAGVDRISCPETALVTLAMAVDRPLTPETIVVLLDGERRGIAIAVVTGTRQPDDVVEVVECLTRSATNGERVGAMIVATVRPGVTDAATAEDDVDRWLEISDIAEQTGVELLEWFVIGDAITCPRDHFGEPPRW
jgi:hypothetical protein